MQCLLSKVTFLLLAKLLVVPALCGLALDYCTLPLLGGTWGARIGYLHQVRYRLADAHALRACELACSLCAPSQYPFGFALMHWVAGITFMLLITITVLELRDLLHPAVLAPFVRRPEQNESLLRSLVREPILVQLRRLVVSVVTYAAILLLQFLLPALLLSWALPSLLPAQMHYVYLLEDIQVSALCTAVGAGVLHSRATALRVEYAAGAGGGYPVSHAAAAVPRVLWLACPPCAGRLAALSQPRARTPWFPAAAPRIRTHRARRCACSPDGARRASASPGC